jgi:hypothetical protein
VEQFNRLYFGNAPAEQLSPIIDACAARFTGELELELELDGDEQADFKIKAKQFVKIYAQVACILSFANPGLGETALVSEVPDSQAEDQGQGQRRPGQAVGERGSIHLWPTADQTQRTHWARQHRDRAGPAEPECARRRLGRNRGQTTVFLFPR